mmetsp:Transcript_16422/g.40663  ORF Transcript_16422/g.40663 Transcript_16422/m.40663 type:complete len:219 (-) Transcript_16422:2689-3345(-)
MRPGMLQMLCSNSSCTSPRSSNTARVGAARASSSKSARHWSTKASAQSYRPLRVALASAAIDGSNLAASGGWGPAAEVCMYRRSSARADCNVCIDLQREACAAFDSLPYNTAITAILRLILSEPCPGSGETSWWSAARSPASPRLVSSCSSGRLYALSCACRLFAFSNSASIRATSLVRSASLVMRSTTYDGLTTKVYSKRACLQNPHSLHRKASSFS